MDLDELAPAAGVVGGLAVLLALGAPYALLTDPSGLGPYYAAGPVGGGGIAFLAVLAVVVFLAGTRGSADPETAAGVAFVLSLALVAVSALWAVGLDPNLVFSFEAADAWMEFHRWSVVGAALVVLGGALGYTRAVL